MDGGDRIVLDAMRFEGTHGVNPEEKVTPQPFEVDVELELDLAPAGTTDDLGRTVDYRLVHETCRRVIEGAHRDLIEALAEDIARALLAAFPVEAVTVRVRKPQVRLGGPLRSAGVQVRRRAQI
jgi:dihydroneopterin aldolase